MKEFDFTKGVESLVDPISVGTLHFLQGFSEKLPIKMQNKIVENASKDTPLMGFIVDPYCTFLCYEIIDEEYFQNQLQEGFSLQKTKVFKDDEPKYYLILGSFQARTSAFLGNRVEAYVITKNEQTGLTSWIIMDYDTNTISYDTAKGLTKPNTFKNIVTTDYNGRAIVDIESEKHTLKYYLDTKAGTTKSLDEKLWIEGNFSVGYGKKLTHTADVFSLKFNPKEMDSAIDLDLSQVVIEENTWFKNYVAQAPDKALCFPYAQHFLSDSPGYSSQIQTKEQLIKCLDETDFSNTEVYSSKAFSRAVILLPTILIIIIIILIIVIISIL